MIFSVRSIVLFIPCYFLSLSRSISETHLRSTSDNLSLINFDRIKGLLLFNLPSYHVPYAAGLNHSTRPLWTSFFIKGSFFSFSCNWMGIALVSTDKCLFQFIIDSKMVRGNTTRRKRDSGVQMSICSFYFVMHFCSRFLYLYPNAQLEWECWVCNPDFYTIWKKTGRQSYTYCKWTELIQYRTDSHLELSSLFLE